MYKINRKVAFPIQYSRTKKSKYCCHPPFHPPIFCGYSSKLLSPTLPKLTNWILLSPPSLSSDPDNPPKFGTCTTSCILWPFCYSYGIVFKGIFADSRILFVFCCSYIFLNDAELGILILITNIALKIQNDVIIKKQLKRLPIFQLCKNI